MVPGSRGIYKCKATVSASVLSAPREPLLFLYPNWARGFASSATAVAPDDEWLNIARPPPTSQQTFTSQASSRDASNIRSSSNLPRLSSSKPKAPQQHFDRSSKEVASKSREPKVTKTLQGDAVDQSSAPGVKIQRLRMRVIPIRGDKNKEPCAEPPLDPVVRKIVRTYPCVEPPVAPVVRKIVRTYPCAEPPMDPVVPNIVRRYPCPEPPMAPVVRNIVRTYQSESIMAPVLRNIVRTYPVVPIYKVQSGPDIFRKIESDRKFRRILYDAECREMAIIHEREIRRKYYEEAQKQREMPNVKPGDVLGNLTLHTPKRADGTILRISVPNSAVEALLFGVDQNILEIKHRTGCDIELLEVEDGKDTRSLLLSGPSICISVAASQIFEIVPEAVSNSTNEAFAFPRCSIRPSASDMTQPAKGDTSPVAMQYYLVSPEKSVTPLKRADSIPKPEEWTKMSLEAYIRSLTTMDMTNHIHRLLYKKDEDHIDMIKHILEEIFALDECLDVMSVTALNEALSYLVKRNRMPQACEIFSRVQKSGFRMSSESFNIMFRGAAKTHNLNTFASFLEVMLRLGYRPDSGTWRAFMMVLDSPKAIFTVFGAMRERGLFHEEGLLSDVCEILLPYEIQDSLDKNLLVSDFVKHMTDRYGEKWLSVAGANKILEELGTRGLVSESWSMVHYMISQNIKPDTVSINTIFTHSTGVDDLKSSIKSLDDLSHLINFVPDEVTYAILFKSAWRWRCYATARAVWQQACLDTCVTFEMRKRVSKSLEAAFVYQNSVNPSLTGAVPPRASMWRLTAGLFVISGVHKSFPEFQPQTEELPAIPELDAHRLAVRAVGADLELFKQWTPVRPFINVLSDSITADYGLRGERDFVQHMEWLLKYAPIVKMSKRPYEIGLRQT